MIGITELLVIIIVLFVVGLIFVNLIVVANFRDTINELKDDMAIKKEHLIHHIDEISASVRSIRRDLGRKYMRIFKTTKIWNIYYECNGQETLVGSEPTYDDAVATMQKMIKHSGFKSHYLRTTKFTDSDFWFDYGSHTTFYWIREEEI